MGRGVSKSDGGLLEAYDATVSNIYEAALTPSRWDIALTSLINHFCPQHWEVAMLLWERLEPATGRFIGASGVNDFARAGYLSMFAGRQPWSINGHALPVGQVVHSDELLPRDRFKKDEFYKSFLSNWNLEVAIIASLDRHGTDHLGLCLPGPDGDDTTALHDAVTRLLPHIQRATRISRRIGEADLRAANAEAALDASPSIIMSLGPGMELLHANATAQRWLGKAEGLAVAHGTMRLADRDSQERLTALACGQGPARTENIQIIDRDRLIFLVAMRVDAAAGGDLSGPNGGASVLLVGGGRLNVSDEAITRLRDWFNLTPSEAKIAAYVADGRTLEDFARDRGVSLNAARFLMKGVFGKTGVGRQAELVALLREAPLGWNNPLEPLFQKI
jgi:DNA-binding CsgD family transcriptional regulator